MLTVSPGYDPRYLTRQVGQGAENYYLSAVTEHGEPPGRWWGLGAEELGLAPGAEVDAATMEKLYATFLDPRDPDFLARAVPDEDKARLGRKPPSFAGMKAEAAAAFARALEAEPNADPERQAQLRRETLGNVRQAVMHHDATFSPPKSVTLLHAGLQAAAVQAREAGNEERAASYDAAAAKVWDAVDEGAKASLSYLQRHAGVARRGSHSQKIDGRTTGKWIDAPDGFVAARFRQHTNRNGEPHLHIHQAILNRQLGSDGRWSGLDGPALYAARPGAGAMGERVMYERLVAGLGVELIPRADGNGYEIAGVTREQIAAFSSRATQTAEYMKPLIEAHQELHGRAPSALTMWKLGQHAAHRTKAGKVKLKDMPSRVEELKAWEKQTTANEVGLLSKIPAVALGRFQGRTAEKARAELAELDYKRVLSAAVADAQQQKTTFSRYEVTRYIAGHLPAYLGGLPTERVEALLEEMTDAALDPAGPAAVRLLNAPDVVEMPPQLQRADGSSMYQAPLSERYTTAGMLDTEDEVIRSATAKGAPGLAPAEALTAMRGHCSPQVWETLCRRVGIDPDRLIAEQAEAAAERTGADGERTGADGERTGAATLDDQAANGPSRSTPERTAVRDADQAAPATAGPAEAAESAGAGAGRVAGAERLLLEDQATAVYGVLTSRRRTDVLVGYAGTGKTFTVAQLAMVWREETGGQVMGFTLAQNAANVLAGEGVDQAWNMKRWLAAYDDGRVLVPPGALGVIDEAAMASTPELLRFQKIFTEHGGKLLHAGDPAQLASPGAGGITRHLAENSGAFTLTEVLRFDQDWEREASKGLRTGVADVLGEYDAHDRVQGGTRQEMADAARHAYLADYLDGKQSLLLAPTNEQAAELARDIRTQLKELGHVKGVEVGLYGEDGQQVNSAAAGDLIVARENNQKITIGDTGRDLSNRDVLLVDQVDRGRLVARLVDKAGKPTEDLVELPADYVKKHVELAYASTVHAAQGRTVWRAFSLVDDSATRNMFYVMMTRGKDGNWAFVVEESDRVADLRPGPEQVADQGTVLDDRAAPLDSQAQPLDNEAAAASPASPSSVRDKFAVLHQILERAEDSETALEAMRAEAQRPTHMGHLGAMLTGITHDHLADAYVDRAEARGALTPSDAARLRADAAKDTLGRLLRQIEMSGRNVDQILDQAIEARELGTADSVGQVLQHRIKEAAEQHGLNATALEPSEDQISGTWTARTPKVGVPEVDEVLGTVGRQLDVRQHTLGQDALAAPPAWLVEPMGTPDAANEYQCRKWAARAGKVLGYREMFGVTDETDVLGSEPSRRNPEQRAAWYAAQDALHGVRPGEAARASIGQLWSARARYERQVATAPPYVADELQKAEGQHRQHRQQASTLRAQAAACDDELQREVLQNRARGQQVLADALTGRLKSLREVHDARRDWHRATDPDRIAAMRADAELRRRDEVDETRLPLLHDHGSAPDVEASTKKTARQLDDQQIPGQLSIEGWDDQPPEPAPSPEAQAETARARADSQELQHLEHQQFMYKAGRRAWARGQRADLPPEPDQGRLSVLRAEAARRVAEFERTWQGWRDRRAEARQTTPDKAAAQPTNEETHDRQHQPAQPAARPIVEEEATEPAGPMPGQMTLDLFGLGEDAPEDPKLASAVEQARAARQVLDSRAEQQQAVQTEDERVRRQADHGGPVDEQTVKRQQQSDQAARQKLENREADRAPKVDPQAQEALRVAQQGFPRGPGAKGPQMPSQPPPKPRGPSRGGPSLG